MVIILFLSVFGLIVLTLHYFSKKNKILRELKKTRKKQLLSIKDNEYAKVIGKAKHVTKPLIAPLSGRECVYYYVHIKRQGHKNKWHTFVKEEQAQDFFIEVNGDQAIIKPNTEPSKMFVVKDFKAKSGFFDGKSTPELERFLNKHSKKSAGFLGFGKTLQYTEGVIELNETIAVKGIGKWKRLKAPVAGYNYSKILTLTGNDKQKLIITDLPEALKPIKNKV